MLKVQSLALRGLDVGPKSRFKALGCQQAMETPRLKQKTQGGWITFHLDGWKKEQRSPRLFPLLPSKLPQAAVPTSAVGQLNQSSAFDLSSTRRNRDGQPDTSRPGWISAILIKTNRASASVCLFLLGGREGRRENLPIKLLKHAAAEAKHSIYSQWHSIWAGRQNTRSIQSLIDDGDEDDFFLRNVTE